METIRQLGNGTRILHSTYPWIDETSENYDAFATRQLLALEASTGLPSKPCAPQYVGKSQSCMVGEYGPTLQALSGTGWGVSGPFPPASPSPRLGEGEGRLF